MGKTKMSEQKDAGVEPLPVSKRKASDSDTHVVGNKPKRQKKAVPTDYEVESRPKGRTHTLRSKRKPINSRAGKASGRKQKVVKKEEIEVASTREKKEQVGLSVKKEILVEEQTVESTPASSRGYSARRRKLVGCHTSIAGGLQNAVYEAVDLGARAFGMFLKSQRQWKSKPLADDVAEKFKIACKEHGFAPHHVVPHGSYLMNCGSPKAESLEKSRAMLVDELQRCEKLGLALFNFHPGSTCGEITVDECVNRIAESINQALQQSKYVTAVVENMSCQGNTIGGKFEELGQIIKKVKNKSRIGVCLDTCHAFAAGYDLKSEAGYHKMMDSFEREIGLKYLKAIHVNDSKGEAGCHLDRHENIGRGKIGTEAFSRFMNDPRFDDIPFVLETPGGDYSREIKKLYSLCKT